MGESTKTLICMDVMNWLSEFWKGDIEIIMRDPWKALRSTEEAVGEFVQAARASNFDVIVVTGSDAKTDQAWQTWRSRREDEILEERRGVCMAANIFLLEAFEKHGVRVVRPIGADAHNVLAAMAVAMSGIVLSRDRGFFYYNVPVKVCREFSVSRGNLRLGPILTRDPSRYPRNISRVIQPDLASLKASASPEHEWTVEIVTKYSPSLMNGAVFRGTSGSSDKRMGNLHVLARPLRAAVYSILGEQVAVEKMPEWSGAERKVTWKETQVLADPALIPVLKTPQAVAAWLVERDARVPPQLEPWRATERLFNTCAIASEMVVVSSQVLSKKHDRATIY